jgi:hypothetical protein
MIALSPYVFGLAGADSWRRATFPLSIRDGVRPDWQCRARGGKQNDNARWTGLTAGTSRSGGLAFAPGNLLRSGFRGLGVAFETEDGLLVRSVVHRDSRA